MLSAKGRDAEVSKGLSIGADLYVTKPFSTRELMGKINALLDAAVSTAWLLRCSRRSSPM